MADTNPQAAATPPVTPLTPDTLVAVKVNHETRQEPLSKLVASYQIQSAAEQKLTQANRQLAEQAQQIQFGQKWQQLQDELAVNPEATIAEMARFVEMRTGRKVSLPGAPQNPTEDGSEGSTPTTRADPRVEMLQREVDSLKKAHTGDLTRARIAQELNAYPAFKNDETARRLAERFLTAAHYANPSVPLDVLASDVHADMQVVMGNKAQQTYDNRTQTQANAATVPTGGGTPAMSEPPPKVTVAEWRKNRTGVMDRINQHFQTQLNGTRSGR